MNLDGTIEQLEAGLTSPDTSMRRVTIPAAEINKYGLRRKAGETDKDQSAWCLTVGGKHYYGYKLKDALKKALDAKSTS